jgi:hypothetical protein
MTLLPRRRDVVRIEGAAVFKIRFWRSGFCHGKAVFEVILFHGYLTAMISSRQIRLSKNSSLARGAKSDN